MSSSSQITTPKKTFEFVHVGPEMGLVVQCHVSETATIQRIRSLHENPIPMIAALLMLHDLRADSEKWDGCADDFEQFYIRVSQLLGVIDFNKSADQNARAIAGLDFARGYLSSPIHDEWDGELPY